MKKFREKMSERAGFTLVELIVVIAIIGILAGAAVAGYSGYIKKAQAASDTQILSAVKTAAEAAVAKEGTVTEIVVTVVGSKVSVVKVSAGTLSEAPIYSKTSETTVDTANKAIADDFELFFKGNESLEFSGTNSAGKAVVSATWTSGSTDWTIAYAS